LDCTLVGNTNSLVSKDFSNKFSFARTHIVSQILPSLMNNKVCTSTTSMSFKNCMQLSISSPFMRANTTVSDICLDNLITVDKPSRMAHNTQPQIKNNQLVTSFDQLLHARFLCNEAAEQQSGYHHSIKHVP